MGGGLVRVHPVPEAQIPVTKGKETLAPTTALTFPPSSASTSPGDGSSGDTLEDSARTAATRRSEIDPALAQTGDERSEVRGNLFTPLEAGDMSDDEDSEDENLIDSEDVGTPQSISTFRASSHAGHGILSPSSLSPGKSGRTSLFGVVPTSMSPLSRASFSLFGSVSPQGMDAAKITWNVNVIPDGYTSAKLCLPSGELKRMRSPPTLRASELLQGLTFEEGQYIFKPPVNGWLGLVDLRLYALVKDFRSMGMRKSKTLWRVSDGLPLPAADGLLKGTRAVFVAPQWTAIGWQQDSAGFVWWFSEQHGHPRCLCGENIFTTYELEEHTMKQSPTATIVHAFAHRYPVRHETIESRQTYHCGCLIEWSHQKYTTLVELAWKNGVGGYGGKSNWCEDKLEKEPVLWKAMPSSMKVPWDQTKSEIRITDMSCVSKGEFESFMAKYSNQSGLPLSLQRFTEPLVYASALVKLRRCSQRDLAGHVLNYVRRQDAYSRLGTNCQTFATDLFAFLTGTKGAQPYCEVLRPIYSQHHKAFVYDPEYD